MKTRIKNKFSERFVNLENKLPLEKFIPAAFLVFLLCVFILSLITYQNIERYKNDIDWMIHSNDVLKKIDEIKYNVVEIPMLRRGYTITGEEKYTGKLDSLISNVKKETGILKELVSDNPQHQQEIKLIDYLASEIFSLVNISVTDSSRSAQSDKIPVDQIYITNKIQSNLDEINEIIIKFKSNEQRLLIERSDKADRTNSIIQNFIIVTGLFSFIVIGLSLFISGRLLKGKSLAEGLLLKSYEELEDTVEERTLELKNTNDSLIEEIRIRKKTEEVLRESEQRFRMMADSAPVLIWISGKDKLFTYLNKAWLDFTGTTLEQELGDGWTEGVHPDDLKKCLEVYTNSFDQRIPFEMEYRLRNAEGEYYWMLDKGIPRFEGTEFAGYIGSCIDINERRKNERYLKIQYDISKTLAESDSLEEASKKLLKNICSDIGWNFGILWLADEKNEYIKPDYFWSEDDNFTKENSELYNDSMRFSKGMDFTGTIFKEGKSMWTKDLSKDKSFKRLEELSRKGWKSGLGIPISNGKETIAIFECFNNKSIEEKKELIEVLESAGRQIGNFMERKRTEEKLRISYLELEEKVKERTNELAQALSNLIKESAEKEKIQSRIKLFAHAVRSIKDCVFITDLDYKTIFVNESFQSAYGYLPDEIIGKEIPVLSDENVTPNLKKDIYTKTLNEGWKGELITYGKSGSGFPTYLSTSSVRNDEGTAEAIVGICQDISDLKRTQEIVNRRNNLLILLNDVIRFISKSFDFNEAVQYSIDKVCEYTHWDIGHCFLLKNDNLVSSGIWNENLTEKYFPFRDISEQPHLLMAKDIPGNTLEKGSASWLDIKTQTDDKHFKRSHVTKSLGINTGIWVPISLPGKTIGILEFFKKDKEQPNQELLDFIYNIGLELCRHYEKLETIDKLKQSEKLLIDAQHIAKLGSWKWDIINNEIIWSDEMYEIYGVDKNVEVLTYERCQKLIHPEELNNINAIIKDSIENKKPFSYYHRIVLPSGDIKTIKAHGELILDENNILIEMFGTVHDVTEIRHAEEELRKINTKLIETQKELIYNEKLAALGRFSSGIAHEIRNPLANINSLAQLISKADIDEKNKRRLNYIITNVDIANKIIKNLLSYATPEDLDFSYRNLKEIIENILESVEARCKNNNIKIVAEIPVDLPLLFIDKLKLESSFMNFVSNSIDAMSDGGTLTVKVEVNKPGNEFIIDFYDTGTGIPQENMDKILEPFFTTKDDGVGLGMGLAYQTIKLHHGEFDIESTEGKGTHINIRLPIRNININ